MSVIDAFARIDCFIDYLLIYVFIFSARGTHKFPRAKIMNYSRKIMSGMEFIYFLLMYIFLQELAFALKVFNFFFTSVFILEAVVKILALGLMRYLSDRSVLPFLTTTNTIRYFSFKTCHTVTCVLSLLLLVSFVSNPIGGVVS